METTFTPVASLAGGALIGLAASLLMLMLGRIMGATGILAGALPNLGPGPSPAGDRGWRLAVLAGMVSGPTLYLLATGTMPALQVPVTWPMLLIGGLLVGFGVTLGSGCTSGHGVCGLARLSPRSLAATLVFMAATGLTVFIVRHVLGN